MIEASTRSRSAVAESPGVRVRRACEIVPKGGRAERKRFTGSARAGVLRATARVSRIGDEHIDASDHCWTRLRRHSDVNMLLRCRGNCVVDS